ncbi:MAG: LPS export ABC transporter periplasmic protein LptC [Candidatus Binatia bacterium]
MRRSKIRMVFLTGILCSLGVVTYKVVESIWLMKAREIRQSSMELLNYAPDATLRINDFHRTKIEGDKLVWEVVGDEARYLKTKQETVIKKPRIVFHTENGETIKIEGDTGDIFFTEEEMEKMQLKGNIRVHYRGFVLYTDDLSYLKGDNQVVSHGKVTLEGKGLTLEAVGAQITLEDEKIRLLQEVKTKIQPDGNRDNKDKT